MLFRSFWGKVACNIIVIRTRDLHLLKVALIFLSKLLLLRRVDYFIKEIKKVVPRALLSYVSTGIFKNTREVRKSLAYCLCFS